LVYQRGGPRFGKLNMHVCGMCKLTLMIIAIIANGENELKSARKGRNMWYQSYVSELELAVLKEKWLSNMQMIMVSPVFVNNSKAKIITMIKSKNILIFPLIIMTMVGMMVDWGKKWKNHFKKSRKRQRKFKG
jgi:hypothetical protein